MSELRQVDEAPGQRGTQILAAGFCPSASDKSLQSEPVTPYPTTVMALLRSRLKS